MENIEAGRVRCIEDEMDDSACTGDLADDGLARRLLRRHGWHCIDDFPRGAITKLRAALADGRYPAGIQEVA